MRVPLNKALPIAGILATLGLFLVIAVMQSRLIADLSASDLQRRKLVLQEGLKTARTEINREITGAFALFQLEDSPPKESWAGKTAEAFTIWPRKSAFPNLVSRVLVAELSEKSDTLQLFAYDRRTRRYEPMEWPDELRELRDILGPPFSGVVAFGIHTFTGVVSPDSPALIFPMGFDQTSRFKRVTAWQIIELDRRYLLQTVVPQILRKNLEQADQFEFLITGAESGDAVIFRSDPNAVFSNVDASLTVMEIANDYFPHGIGGSVPRHQLLFRENVNKPGQLPDKVGDGGLWRLQVRHRLGSLDAAVTRMRRGNLLLSFVMIALAILDLAVLALLARRMHRLSDAKAQFAAAVSHELRTPLAAICSAADNLAAGVAHEPQRVQQYGAAILEQGKQLASMVEQILAFASGQAAKKAHESEMLDVAELLRQSVAAVASAARAAGVEIEINIAPDVPDILGDAAAVQQALNNLLTNAIKYGGAGRSVRVSASRNASGELEIAVEDHGPGIPASDLKRIFEPFYRGFNAATLRVHGSGLGLTIVDRIARDHGGRVTVATTPGQGTCFTLHFPPL